jgi:hypothetical protein
MSEGSRNQQDLEKLLAYPPAEVMSMFQLDIRRSTQSIEGCVSLLHETDLSKDEYERVIDILKREVIKVREGYDYILSYLEKLQESRKENE